MLYDTTQIALERTIQGAAMRNEALAANLANANTPGYARVDVDFHGALARAMGTGSPREALHSTAFAAETDGTGAQCGDGRPVDLSAAAEKLAANGREHQTALQLACTRLHIVGSSMGVT